jgi:hypothetical protein
MVLASARVTGFDPAFSSAIQARTTGEETSFFRIVLNHGRSMANRRLAAERADRSAVTGPCVAEYGPDAAGNKKITNTQTTARIASSHPSRRESIAVCYWLYRKTMELKLW